MSTTEAATERWPDVMHVRVAREQREALVRIAAAEQRSAASVVREAVAHLLRDHDPEQVTP